jgi:hypothetical protein
MCCDSLSDRALLIHGIMVARPMKLPMTPPSLCSGFDATCVGLVPTYPCTPVTYPIQSFEKCFVVCVCVRFGLEERERRDRPMASEVRESRSAGVGLGVARDTTTFRTPGTVRPCVTAPMDCS